MDRAKLRNDLVRDEGLRLAAYRDTNGFWTIGVGHLLGPDTGSGPRMSFITNEEADALLDFDVSEALKSLSIVFGAANILLTDDVRTRALVNMAFNRGLKHMQESTTITPAIKKALASRADADWATVATAILTSPWGKQIGKRAERLAHAFATGKDMA